MERLNLETKRNTAPALQGLIVIDKPLHKTSMDIVRFVRRAAGGCKTGHAGTLDPLATGILICCLGKATRLVEFLMNGVKEYRTAIDLSAFTATDDAEGEREEVQVEKPPVRERIEEVLNSLTGEIEQQPPIYSALKIGGTPAYKLARKGREVKLAARSIRIDSIETIAYRWPILELQIVCGRGTYIRSLARQIGTALNTGGYLQSLRRTRVGAFTLERTYTLETLPQPLLQEHLIGVETLDASSEGVCKHV